MRNRRAYGISLLLTLLLAIAVLAARDQFLVSEGADANQGNDATAAAPATATELPLVNLVRTSQGETVAIPVNGLSDTSSTVSQDHENETDEHDDGDDDEDERGDGYEDDDDD
jgi:hypothetical protein